jgi:AcrR family transcriptional regulator
MARKYELKRRAERQDETRQRIVEAAVALHTTIGPARSTISAVAERAGVQRHTVYRHFPDEQELFLACSGLYSDQHPMPDPAEWRAIADTEARLRRGLSAIYDYFAKHAHELLPIVRDAEIHAPTRELFELRFRPQIERIRDTLIEPFHARGARRTRLVATLMIFLDLRTWDALSRTLRQPEVIEVAVRALQAQ